MGDSVAGPSTEGQLILSRGLEEKWWWAGGGQRRSQFQDAPDKDSVTFKCVAVPDAHTKASRKTLFFQCHCQDKKL